MKKLTIATLLAMSAFAASAVEVGVTTNTSYAGPGHTQAFGVTVGQQFGDLSVTGGAERFNKGINDQNRYSVTAGYDVTKIGPVTITPTVGVSYLDNRMSADGYALNLGVGASTPITKNITVAVNASHQYGQRRVNQFDGNMIGVGLKYKF